MTAPVVSETSKRLVRELEQSARAVADNYLPLSDRHEVKLELIAARTALLARIAALEEALKPFATWGTPKLSEDGRDQLEGLPDSHGFELVWADEDEDSGTPCGRVELTAGQFRRARALRQGEQR